MTWVRPELVIRAEIGGWTRDGIVRQTAFKGIDEGHDPLAVTREQAVSSEEAAAQAEELMPESDEIDERSDARRRPPRAAEPATFAGATEAELEALAALPNEGAVARRGPRAEADEPRQAAVRAARGQRRGADHEARADRVLRPDRAGDADAPRRAAAQPPAVPERRRLARVLAEGHPLDRRPTGCGAGRRSASTTATRTPTWSPTRSPSCAGSATRPRSRSTPGPAGSPGRTGRRSPSSTSTPARRRRGTRRSRSPGSTGPRSSISACGRTRR